MPLTLALDDELGALLSHEAQKTGQQANDLASSLLRAALTKPQSSGAKTPFRIQPHAGTFAAGILPAKLNRLADEMDTDAFLARQTRQS